MTPPRRVEYFTALLRRYDHLCSSGAGWLQRESLQWAISELARAHPEEWQTATRPARNAKTLADVARQVSACARTGARGRR